MERSNQRRADELLCRFVDDQVSRIAVPKTHHIGMVTRMIFTHFEHLAADSTVRKKAFCPRYLKFGVVQADDIPFAVQFLPYIRFKRIDS